MGAPGGADRARGGAEFAAAGLVERLEVGEADGGGDGRDGERGLAQEVRGAFEAAAPDVGDDGGAGGGAEEAREVVVGQADRGGDAGDGEGPREVRLDVGEGGGDGGVPGGFGGQLGEPPQDGPDLGGGAGGGLWLGGDGAAEGLGDGGAGGSGVAHDGDLVRRTGLDESEVDVQVLGGAAVAEAGLGAGRDEADAAGPDLVGRAVHGEVGLVVVEVELPQVGQAEVLLVDVAPVEADAGLDDGGRGGEVEPDVLHGENRPPVGDYGQRQGRD
nr:hypothetical protein GCM10025732_39120 [Glycomyces mayteni]